MKPRSFVTRGEIIHKIWLSGVLGIPYFMNGGIDLADDYIGVELKCRYKKYHPTFTVHSYQISEFEKENPGKELFWAFLLYDLIVS